MRQLTTLLFLAASISIIIACNSGDTKASDPLVAGLSQSQLIERGKYLVDVAGCHDCHSPKVMTQHGPAVDSTRILSGHPAGSPLPPLSANATTPGSWLQMAPDVTAFAGPWGMSFSANLTSDSATGIGAWTVSEFINTIRKGKHLGQDNGRPILPPMPWEGVAKFTDEDLTAIYTYLKTVPAISNRVPAPVPPNELATGK